MHRAEARPPDPRHEQGRRRQPQPQPRRSSWGWDLTLIALLATGAVVEIEPAPFDLLAALLIPIALLTRRLRVDSQLLAPIALLGLFLAANVFSFSGAVSLAGAARFEAITVYLVGLWLLLVGLIHDGSRSGPRGSAERVHAIMRGWSIAAVVCGLLGIATSFGLLPLGSTMLHYGRLEGFFKDENVFGAWCAPICVYAIARLVALRGGRRWWWLLTLLVGAMVVLLTYSRGAWINLTLSAVVFYILRLVSVGSRRAKVITLLALPVAITALGIALFQVLSMDSVQEMLATRLKMQSYDTHRFATQEEAIRAALEHPLGIGPGQSELMFERAAHSTYVRSLVENGFLGFLSLGAFMALSGARAAWYAVDALDDEQQLLCAVVAGSMAGLLVESLVIDSIHWRHFFVVLALAWLPCRGGALRRRRGATA